MQTEKVHLTEEKETMLLALYSRAMESPSKDPLLDPKLELVTELQPREGYGYDRLPGSLRALLRVMGLFPSLRKLNRLLRYQF